MPYAEQRRLIERKELLGGDNKLNLHKKIP